MNRIGRAALAPTIGFSAAGAAILAGATDGDDGGSGTPEEVVGGVDVFAYCQQEFGNASQAMLVGTNAFSWRCTNEANGLFQLENVDTRADRNPVVVSATATPVAASTTVTVAVATPIDPPAQSTEISYSPVEM